MNYIESLPDFKGKKVLFLAETNYQIINCINMACHMEETTCDLYLNSFYDNSSQIGKSLRQFAIFRNIRIYKSTQNRLIKAYNFVFLKNI